MVHPSGAFGSRVSDGVGGISVGKDVKVIVGIAVFVEMALGVSTQDTKMIDTSRDIAVFFFIDTLLCKGMPNGLRYWLVGGTLIHSTGRKCSEYWKCSKSRTVPTHPVHVLLGANWICRGSR